MTVYGTKIKSDVDFPLDLSHETETRYELELSSEVPVDLKKSIICGFPFYTAHDREVYLYSNRDSDDVTLDQTWCYEVQDILKFYWRTGERIIYYELSKKGNVDLLSFCFIHLMLPFYLTLENLYDFFHAGAVEIDGKPIFFVAPSMGGKSTMTDYFIKQGHTFISDDKVPTFIQNRKFMTVSSHSYHRPYRKNEDLGYYVKNISLHFKPLHAFYVLKKVSSHSDIIIEEINGLKKLDIIFPNYLYSFPYLRSKRLKYLSKMLNEIKVFRIHVPMNMNRLGDVYDEVLKHSRDLV